MAMPPETGGVRISDRPNLVWPPATEIKPAFQKVEHIKAVENKHVSLFFYLIQSVSLLIISSKYTTFVHSNKSARFYFIVPLKVESKAVYSRVPS